MARKRGWLIFFILFGVFIFFGLMFIFGIMTAFDNRPVVRTDTVLQFNLSGLVTEHFPRDAFGKEFEGASSQMHDIRKALAMAKVDDRIRGIYLRVSLPQIGWAKSQELRNLLLDFKESGKFITAFMDFCNEKSYYLALAADEIYLQPHSLAEFNGFAAEIPFLKRMFNKVGAEPQVENIGKYKSAGDIYKRESMTPAHREVTQNLLDDIFEEFTETVSQQRGINKGEFVAAINKGIHSSEGAFEFNLVDSLSYEANTIELLKKKVYGENNEGKNLRMMSLSRYAKIPYAEVGLDGGSKVALIYAIGGIVSGSDSHDPLRGRNMGSRSITRHLRSAKKNKSIKAVVIRVDSPGGSSIASDEIWSEINSVRKIKPVVISMSDLAASGGYWMSMDADAIVAQPLTITGSIGVVLTLFDLSDTYGKLGINWEIVKKGTHADMPTDKRAMTDEEWTTFKKMSREVYDVFVQKVADGRDKSWDEIDQIAQGRIWTGEDALKLGLVDSLGGLEVALEIAKEKSGIAEETKTQWLVYPQPKGFLESVFERLGARAAGLLSRNNQDLALFRTLAPETKSILKQIAIMSRVRSGDIMAVAPYIPEIN